MQHDAGVRTLCDAFATLASPERLRIVRLLATGSHSVTEIATALAIPPVNLSHHLSTLRAAQLVVPRKQGRQVIYSLRPGVLPEGRCPAAVWETLDLGCCKFVMPLATGAETPDQPPAESHPT